MRCTESLKYRAIFDQRIIHYGSYWRCLSCSHSLLQNIQIYYVLVTLLQVFEIIQYSHDMHTRNLILTTSGTSGIIDNPLVTFLIPSHIKFSILYSKYRFAYGPANGRRRYNGTSSLIGWAHTQNNPCNTHIIYLSPMTSEIPRQSRQHTIYSKCIDMIKFWNLTQQPLDLCQFVSRKSALLEVNDI